MAVRKSMDFSYNDVLHFSEALRYASPRIKELMLEHIDRELKWNYFNGLDDVPYCDISKAIDVGEEMLCWGPNYLYVWFDKSGVPFYAGKGRDTARMAQVRYKSRSDAFKAKISEGGCHSVMVAMHISDKHIDMLEKELIAYLYCAGHPIVNNKDLPDSREVVLRNLFKECRDASKASEILDADVSKKWAELSDRWYKMGEVYLLVDSLVGEKWNGKSAELKPPAFEPRKLEYNGIKKTYAQWAKEPGVTVTGPAIRKRIENGWPVHDALFTPAVKHGPGQATCFRKESKS